MNLKDFARPYTVPNGVLRGVVFWLLPYKTLQVQMSIEYLDAISPRARYENAKTGEQQPDKPAELIRAETNVGTLTGKSWAYTHGSSGDIWVFAMPSADMLVSS